jgi:aryl-alcohol dehydrogenase
MKIQAAIAQEQHGAFMVGSVDLDDPRDDEILVEIAGVGLCHTDLAVRDGAIPLPLPAVLGHEGSGIVKAVGAKVTKVKVGDSVIMSFRSCGVCKSCEHDDPAYCASFMPLNFAGCRPDGSHSIHRDGQALTSNFFGQSSFATFALAYESNVVKVDAALPLATLGPLGCGIQTGAGAVMVSLAAREKSSILILGGGTVGLAGVLGAVVQGCKTIIVSEPHQYRRDLAISLGATHVIDPLKDGNLEQAVLAIMPEGVDYVLDTTGIAQVLASAVMCMATRGTLGLVAVPSKAGVTFPIDPMLCMAKGLKIQGIVEGDSDPDTFLPRLVKLYSEGKFPFDKMIKFYPLAEINQAIEDQHHGVCVKPVLLPNSAK